MKMAKASADDIRNVIEFFEFIEAFMEGRKKLTDDRFATLLARQFNHPLGTVGTSWRRVVHGCESLIRNCCNPDKDYLDWRPDIAAFIESQKQAESSQAINKAWNPEIHQTAAEPAKPEKLIPEHFVIRSIGDVFNIPDEFFEEALESLFASLRSAKALGGITKEVTVIDDGHANVSVVFDRRGKDGRANQV